MSVAADSNDCGATKVSFRSFPNLPSAVFGFGNMPSRTGDLGVRLHSHTRQAIPPVKTARPM